MDAVTKTPETTATEADAGAGADSAGKKTRKARTTKALLALKVVPVTPGAEGDPRTFQEVDIGNTGAASKAKTALDKVAAPNQDYLVYRYVGTYRRTEKTKASSSLK